MSDSPVSQTPLNVNGDDVLVDTPANAPLLSALREELGLRGARTGCGIGECGSCTVLVDGAPTRSCITPVGSVAGTRVVTPEGLGTPDCPSPVQQAFIDEQAAQCGFCINGMIMKVHSMLGRADVNEASIADALGEHVCRCGTHSRIVRAACRALTQDSHPAQAPGPDLVVRDSLGQDSGAAAAALPVGSPVEARLRLRADGRVEVLAGKVELGQGIVTAFAQIAAAQLRLPVDHVVVRPASSAEGPDDGYTSGSASLEDSGIPLAASARAFRRLLLERAGLVLGVEPQQLTQEAERFVAADGSEVTLAQLAGTGPIVGTVATTDVPDWALSPLGRMGHRIEPLPA
jgi:aerobic-type carbon monoxide dehydrogenase small subunit (CoxS/CutS family)